MKKWIFFYILLIFTNNLHAQKLVLVRGYITSTEDYCNGARPSDEMLQDVATEKPYANKTIYVKVGTLNKSSNKLFKKVKTNADGRFEIWLKPGVSYYFVEEWKGKLFVAPRNTKEIKWDITCLRKRYATPDYVIKVTTNNNPEIQINYHKQCAFNPYCGNFSGPLPP